jgi:hypothetical protein
MREFALRLIPDKLLKEFRDQIPITIREETRRSESFPQFSCSPLWDKQIGTELDTTISFPDRKRSYFHQLFCSRSLERGRTIVNELEERRLRRMAGEVD